MLFPLRIRLVRGPILLRSPSISTQADDLRRASRSRTPYAHGLPTSSLQQPSRPYSSAAAGKPSNVVTDPSYTAASTRQDDAKWVMDMPTRAIAHFLLQRAKPNMEQEALYEAVRTTGLLRSNTHYRQCLQMMRRQGRLHIFCLGPESVGSHRRKFVVSLTKKGVTLFTWYRSVGGYAGGAHWRKAYEEARGNEVEAEAEEARGLTEALP